MNYENVDALGLGVDGHHLHDRHDRDRGRGRGHDRVHGHGHGHGRGHCAYYQQLFDRVYDWCGYAHDRVLRAHDCGRLNRIVFITKVMLTSD